MSWNERLDKAREAYQNKDKTAAAKAHDPKVIIEAAKEEHGSEGNQYIGSVVYGGLDGVVTTFCCCERRCWRKPEPKHITYCGVS